jgi:hypothetical protein
VSDGQAAVLSADQREALGQALADALRCRTPDGECTGCDEHSAWLCNDHAVDLDLNDAYLALARELGSRGNGDRAMQPEGGDGVSDKRVMTDDQVRDLADAASATYRHPVHPSSAKPASWPRRTAPPATRPGAPGPPGRSAPVPAPQRRCRDSRR